MARQPRKSDDSPENTPRRRKSARPRRTKTDLSAYLHYPIASMNDEAFEGLCDQIHNLLNPRVDLEHRCVDEILWLFGKIRRTYIAMAHGASDVDQYLSTLVQSFRSSQKTFDTVRKFIDSDPEHLTSPLQVPPTLITRSRPAPPVSPSPTPPESAPEPQFTPEPELDPEPDFGTDFDPATEFSLEPDPDFASDSDFGPDSEFDPDSEIDDMVAAARDWRIRIAMVPSVDPRWPVLDQFNLRVDDVLTLRDRGVPEDEILDQHPGLTYSDLASCYACEADGYRGPLEPPYPLDITVVEVDPESD